MLPLAVGVKLFGAIVEGSMRFGRWLYATAEGELPKLDKLYESWAKVLLGGDQWQSGALASAELGWRLSGSGRAIVDIAMRRASLWSLPGGDLYHDVFVSAHDIAGNSWAQRSLHLLREWGLEDLPQ